jgi:hypothetical protein
VGERGRVDISLVELAELSAIFLPKARNPPKQRRSSHESPASNDCVWRQGALRRSAAPSYKSAIAFPKEKSKRVAFTREESAETAAEVELPDRPISPHPNLVTASGLEALANAMAEWRAAYNAAHQIEDAGERRRAVALASREMICRSSDDRSGRSATD